MADEFPQFDGPALDKGHLFIDDEGDAALILASEIFATAPAPSNPLYIGASGETVIRLGTRTASQLYLGARSLF